MPKKGKGKKGKKGGKKGKKRTKKLPAPPPLHDLTEIYKNLENALRTMFDMRVEARKKRLEGWFMMREITESRSDSELYMDYLQDSISELQTQIERFLKLLQDERDALAKAIEDVVRDLQKRLLECIERSDQIERELETIRNDLLEFEPLMFELARLMEQIKDLLRQIEEAKFVRDQKVRHLTNQFLVSRAQLHNHLEEQLFYLIQHCRKFIMPILWNFMQDHLRDNQCLRFKVARKNDKNQLLTDKRDELRKERTLLTIAKPYWSIAWALKTVANFREKKHKERFLQKRPTFWGKEYIVTSSEDEIKPKPADSSVYAYPPPVAYPSSKTTEALATEPRLATPLARDFNKFLLQRLTATREAQDRSKKEKQIAEEEFMRNILEETTRSPYDEKALWEMTEQLGEQEFWYEDEEWEDFEEDKDGEVEEYDEEE